jgi:hypothetical protein
MAKKKANAPKKIVGGRILGKEGEFWYAVKVNGFDRIDYRDFKRELGIFCKEFFIPPADVDESEVSE